MCVCELDRVPAVVDVKMRWITLLVVGLTVWTTLSHCFDYEEPSFDYYNEGDKTENIDYKDPCKAGECPLNSRSTLLAVCVSVCVFVCVCVCVCDPFMTVV